MSRSATNVRRSTRFVPLDFEGGSREVREEAARALAASQRSLPWVVSVDVQARRGKGLGVRVVSLS